jgi:nucleotide-binding universal stress UspA family protein
MQNEKQGDRSTLEAAGEVLAGQSQKGWLARLLPFLGPAFIASVAYVDPGNYCLLTRRGQPAAEIVAAAAEIEADLIVMGGYHHTFLPEWLLGSTLDEVLRNTSLPLLVA